MSTTTAATKSKKTSRPKADHSQTDESRAESKRLREVLAALLKTCTETNRSIRALADNASFGTQNKKKKKDRDPNAPKKNKNAYMFYCDEHRENVKKENPGMDGKDIVKFLSKKWGSLDEKGKAPYQNKAEADKVRYNAAKKVFVATATPAN